MTMTCKPKIVRPRLKRLELDEALIALFIGAMDANHHVAREELARAHHLIWSTKRFRRKSGETVGRLIDRMKRLLEEQEPSAVMEAAAKAIPAKLRPSAFAIVADLLACRWEDRCTRTEVLAASGRQLQHPGSRGEPRHRGHARQESPLRRCSPRIRPTSSSSLPRRPRTVRRLSSGSTHTAPSSSCGRACIQVEASRPVRLSRFLDGRTASRDV